MALYSSADSVHAIVADIGAWSTKIGYAGEDYPRSYFRSVRSKACLLSQPLRSNLSHSFAILILLAFTRTWPYYEKKQARKLPNDDDVGQSQRCTMIH